MRKFVQAASEAGTPLIENIDVQSILAKTAIQQILDKKLDHSLRQDPGLVVTIEVPSEAWSSALRRQLTFEYADVHAHCYRSGKRASRSEEEDILVAAQRMGNAVVAISTDVQGSVPLSLRVVADAELKFYGLTRRSLGQAIKTVTGRQSRSVRDEDAAMDLTELSAALRPGSVPMDCLRRLRVAALRQQEAFVLSSNGPFVSELPLTASVKTWTDDILQRLQQLESGDLTTLDAPFTLLSGPPGTGKTLLAQAIARSAGWRFVSTSVTSWFENSDGHLGGVTRAAADFFRQVEENDRTVGFIDELDALPDRGTLATQHREWWNTVVTGFLLNIDKLRRSQKSVVLLAATNYLNRIDDAVLRHGRIGLHVLISPPRSRWEILDLFRYYLGEHLPSSELERVVEFAVALGLPTPAAIAGWVSTAKARALAAARPLAAKDVERAMAGDDGREPAELYSVAIHEAGHAIVAAVLGVRVSAVSVLRNGTSAGSMISDLSTVTFDRKTIENFVTVALAGRAADMEMLGRCDAGAKSDLAVATRLLLEAQFRFGLFDQLLSSDAETLSVLQLNEASRLVIEKRLQELLQRSRALVRHHRSSIVELAQCLVKQRVVSGEDVRRIAKGKSDAVSIAPAQDPSR